jgi:vesicular inhibitory amino acid transporter
MLGGHLERVKANATLLNGNEPARKTSPMATSPLFPRPREPGSRSVSLDHDRPSSDSGSGFYDGDDLTTEVQTVFNIVNNYVGMVLLSMSFCFASAGWFALPLLFVLTLLGGYTGALIVLSYATIANAGETVPSYAKIGEHSCGAFGKWLVVVSSVIETFFCLVSMNIITWKNVACFLPDLSLQPLILLCIVLSFPTNWLTDFNRLSFLSAFGLGCVIFICGDIGYEAAEQMLVPSSAPQTAEQHSLLDARGLPMAASIMFAGLTGHVSLPPIYASMKRPSRFGSTLVWSFSAMFVFYALVGACGYLLYGQDASVIVTEDMASAARGPLDRLLVNLILVGMAFKLFCSVPMCVVVLTDIAENLHAERYGKQMRKDWVMYLRISCWLCGVVSSVLFYDSLEYVTAFVGEWDRLAGEGQREGASGRELQGGSSASYGSAPRGYGLGCPSRRLVPALGRLATVCSLLGCTRWCAHGGEPGIALRQGLSPPTPAISQASTRCSSRSFCRSPFTLPSTGKAWTHPPKHGTSLCSSCRWPLQV